MRAPLIVLILIFAVSVLGLTLIPGTDAQGGPWRMSFFDAFYFMSYTATTIGFGELPQTFNAGAAALGDVLDLPHGDRLGVRDRLAAGAAAGPRVPQRARAAALHPQGGPAAGAVPAASPATARPASCSAARSTRSAAGSSSSTSTRTASSRSTSSPYHADVPGLVADARDPDHLVVAGLDHAYCEGVLALTNDDEANLAVTMTAALLRPDLPVIARTVSPAIEDRMHAFGTPTVVNPFDRFGDHLRLAMRAPASYQLLTWLESGPGAELPPAWRPADRAAAGSSAATAASAASSPRTCAPRAWR